jgi:hypothetical protein
MPLDWNGMVFVQRWRSAVARGLLVGIRRPRDRTYLDVRVSGAELSVGSTRQAVDVELVDAGDIARERRLAILDRVSVVIEMRVDSFDVNPDVAKSHPIGTERTGTSARDSLRPASRVSGIVRENDGACSAVVDIGFPIIMTVADDAVVPTTGNGVAFAAPGEIRGYLVVG